MILLCDLWFGDFSFIEEEDRKDIAESNELMAEASKFISWVFEYMMLEANSFFF